MLPRVHSHAPSIRSHRGTKVVWPDFQPMRIPKEPVCIHLFRQDPVFTSLHLKSPFLAYRLRYQQACSANSIQKSSLRKTFPTENLNLIVFFSWYTAFRNVVQVCSEWLDYFRQSWVLNWFGRKVYTALQRTNTENSEQIFPEKELRGHSPNFHIHVTVNNLYIPAIDLPILLQEICGPSCENLNRSQHESGNSDWGRVIPRKGIHKWDFLCSAEQKHPHAHPPLSRPFAAQREERLRTR